MGYPARAHVDYEGCSKGHEFLKYCSDHSIQISMCAGEAHWQNGIVERHIGVFNTILDRLLLEKEAEIDSGSAYVNILDNLASECTQIKNDCGRYGGSSPSQWMTGRRHPILDSDKPPPMGEDDIENIESHLVRRSHIAGLFSGVDVQATITLAERARHRIVIQPQVYIFGVLF